MKQQPSDYFLAAVLRAYDAEAATGKPVSCSAIWDHICMEAIQGERGAFVKLFEWDTRRGDRNRIGTIKEVIARGQVPGLRLGADERGRWVVERDR